MAGITAQMIAFHATIRHIMINSSLRGKISQFLMQKIIPKKIWSERLYKIQLDSLTSLTNGHLTQLQKSVFNPDHLTRTLLASVSNLEKSVRLMQN